MFSFQKFKYFEDFDFNCREVVVRRMIEQSTDYRFDPNLQRACKSDISHMCSQVLVHQSEDKDLEGKVINCLKVSDMTYHHETLFRLDIDL